MLLDVADHETFLEHTACRTAQVVNCSHVRNISPF